MLEILHSTATVAVVGGVLGVAFCVGDELLSRWVTVEDARERLVFSTCLGSGVLAGCLLLLGLAGLLHGATVGGLFVVALAASRSRVRHLAPLLSRAIQELTARRNAASAVCLSLTVAVLLYLLVTGLLPPFDWDSLAYHLAVPKYFLAHYRVQLPPANLHAAFIGVVQMLYLPFLALNLEAGPGLLNAGFAVLLGLAVHAAAERFFGGGAADFALCGLWASTVIILVAPTPRMNVTLALFVFSAQLAMLHAIAGPRFEVRWLLLAAALVGLSFGVKYHGGLYGASLLPLLFAQPRRLVRERAQLGWAILVAGAFAAPWLLKNLLLFHAPLYPFVSRPILPPWFARLNGSSTAEAVPMHAFRVLRQIRHPLNVRDFFLSPGKLVPELEGRLYFANPLFLALPIFAALLSWKKVLLFVAPPAIYIAGLLLVSRYTNTRYLVPAFPSLTCLAAAGGHALLSRVRPAGLKHALIAAAAFALLVPTMVAATLLVQAQRPFGVIAGTESRLHYAERQLPGYFRARDFVNKQIGPRDSVLMLFEARSYYLGDPYIPDVVLLNWPRVYAITKGSCLPRGLNTYLLVNSGIVNYYVNRGMQMGDLGWGRFKEFSADCLNKVSSIDGYDLYKTR